MEYADRLAGVLAEVRELALEKFHNDWVRAGYHDENPELLEQDRAFAEDVDRVLERFDFFTTGDPDQFQIMINYLGIPESGVSVLVDPDRPNIAGGGSGVYGHLMAASREDWPLVVDGVDDWTGRAADRFRRNVLSQFYRVNGYQAAMALELAGFLGAYRDVMAKGREVALQLAEGTRAKLAREGGSAEVGVILAVVGAVAVVAGVVATGGAAVVAAGVEASVGVLSAVASAEGAPAQTEITLGLDSATSRAPEPPEITLEGWFADEILESLNSKLTELFAAIKDEEDLIETALADDLDQIGPSSVDRFLLTLPDGGTSLAEDLATFTPVSLDTVQASCEQLYQAGRVDMSSAAWHYAQASSCLNLAGGLETAAFGGWFVRTSMTWYYFRTRVESEILAPTSDALINYGDALCATAEYYLASDGTAAADVHRILEDYANDPSQPLNHRPTMNNRPEPYPHRLGAPQ